MADLEAVLWPECGWTGVEDELVVDGDDCQCPACAQVIEFVE
jgi:hypothetical protein